MAVEQNKTIPDDEIDFKSLWSKIIYLLSYPIVLLINNLKITFVFILAAILLSISLKYSLTKTYKSNFIIRPNEKNERIHLKSLDDIQKLLNLKDFEAISRELKVDVAAAKTIVGMEVNNFAYAKNKADSSNTTTIELELTDFNQLLPMQNILLNYLESNPFLTKIKEYQRTNIALKSGLIDKDIVLLDSLKKMQLASYDKLKITEQNSVFLKDLINPTSTYTLSLERLNQKAGLIGQTMFLDNFQLVKGVVVSEKPTWPPRILIMLIFFTPVFLILCVLFLHIKSRRSSKKILA